MSRPIQGDDAEHAGLLFAKLTWTFGLINRPALRGGFIVAERGTVGVQLELFGFGIPSPSAGSQVRPVDSRIPFLADDGWTWGA
jgi:hypothetical protein